MGDYPDAACETGEACLELGRAQFELGGPDEDRKLAFVYFHLGCELDHGPSCRHLYRMTQMIGGYVENPVARDAWRHGLLERACRLGDGLGCNVWVPYAKGADKQYAREQAATLLRAGCEAGDQAQCLALADHVEPEEEAKLLRAVCDELGVKAKGPDAITAAYACELFAVRARDGEGIPRSKKLHDKYLARSCKIDRDGCGQQTGLAGGGGG